MFKPSLASKICPSALLGLDKLKTGSLAGLQGTQDIENALKVKDKFAGVQIDLLGRLAHGDVGSLELKQPTAIMELSHKNCCPYFRDSAD